MSDTSFVHVAIAFDQNYLKQFYALIASIAENNQGIRLHLHCIATGITSEDEAVIKDWLQNRKISINFYSIDKAFASRFVLSSNWTMAVYYRLFFPFLIPETIDRLLYIDTDTLVVNNLLELYQHPLDGFPVGAVYDNYVKTQPLIGITAENEYFNSGVLLIDIPLWKTQRISEQCFDYLLQFPERIKFVDQCALNAVLKQNWKKLDWKYNVLYTWLPEDATNKQLKRFIADKYIIHFTLHRPWNVLCRNRFRVRYFKYLKSSPAPEKSRYHDFTMNKILPLIKLRILEMYTDQPYLKKLWRGLKRTN